MAATKNTPNYKQLRAALETHLRTGQYAPVYLVMGEQDYLRTENRNLIRDTLLGTGDPMNAAYFTGDQFTIEEIRDLGDTLPFLSERRVITIENSWLFDNKGGNTDALTDYLKVMPETTHIVFVEKAPDKTRRLYREIKNRGYILDCVTPYEEDLGEWVNACFQEAGLVMADDAMRWFLGNAGGNMLLMRTEMDKLISYCHGRRTITMQDVRAICSVQIKDRIFDMISAITAHDVTLALQIYMELLQRQTSPQAILQLMIRNFNQLLQVGELSGKGVQTREIAGMLHLNPWIVSSKIVPMLKGHTAAKLVEALDACLQMDLDYKSGRIDPRIAIEELIIRSASGTIS